MEFIIDKEKIRNMNNVVFLYSIGGGFGNLSKIVGKKLIETYKGKVVGRIITDFFPDVVKINKKGYILDNISYKLYSVPIGNYNFLVLYGDFQIMILEDPGLSLYFRYKFMNKLFRIINKFNLLELSIIGGIGSHQLEPENPNYLFSLNKYYDINKIKEKLGEPDLYKSNNVVGMSGLFLYYSQLFKKPAYLLLVETYLSNQINGYFGASKALEILGKLYGFQVDTTDLKEKGKKLKERLEKDLNMLKKLEEENKKREKSSGYYYG